MATMPIEEIERLQLGWYRRIEEIKTANNQYLAQETLAIHMEIATVAFILQTGLTPETAPAYIESRIESFERLAKGMPPDA